MHAHSYLFFIYQKYVYLNIFMLITDTLSLWLSSKNIKILRGFHSTFLKYAQKWGLFSIKLKLLVYLYIYIYVYCIYENEPYGSYIWLLGFQNKIKIHNHVILFYKSNAKPTTGTSTCIPVVGSQLHIY